MQHVLYNRMESLKSFFESFKEFIWDIIGYLVPGLFSIILLSACINSKYFYDSPLKSQTSDQVSFLLMFLGYVLGYVIYGYSELKERIMGDSSYMKKKEKEVEKRETFKKAREVILSSLKSTSEEGQKLQSVRELRNVAMSASPESDQKVYTFMFRSELSRHIANVCFTVGIVGLFNSMISCQIEIVDLFHTGPKFTILYTLLVITYFFLRETRNRFYVIAISIPFSIYLSKHLK